MHSMDCTAHDNGLSLSRELDWLEAVIAVRFAAYTDGGGPVDAAMPPPPALQAADGPYARLAMSLAPGAHERLLLILALSPYLAPERLDAFLLNNSATGRSFTEFGGVLGQSHKGFLPTAETAMFLLAGTDIPRRLALAGLFHASHPLQRQGVLQIVSRHADEPPLSGVLRVSSRGLHQLLHGDAGLESVLEADFPASPITTPLDWCDLVLDDATLRQIEMVSLWQVHGRRLMEDWGLARRLKPGYRALFHGPPGTGKTLTACLLGKRHGLPVCRVDLSEVVSKWVGETERNLALLFDQAEALGWILFFDEADALFGRRGEARSSNDHAVNHRIAYLLQRLESHAGLAILATNQNSHLDEAFSRCFQCAVHFPMPDAASRLRLWRESFSSPGFQLAPDVDFKALAERYELAGGAIINVLRHAALMAAQHAPAIVHAHDLLDGIRLELQKDGRYLSR